MSLLPMLFSDWWENLDSPHSLFDQHFGMDVDLENILDSFEPSRSELMYRPYYRRRRYHPFLSSISMRRSNRTGGLSTIQADPSKFIASLDVQQFAPEEVKVKVVDKTIVIEGKHEDKEDEHGSISRHFVRKYYIPEQCDEEKVESRLSSDAVITVTCPRKEPFRSDTGERPVKILYTGRPAVITYDKSGAEFFDAQRDPKDPMLQRVQQQYSLQQQQQLLQQQQAQRKKGNIKIT